MSNASLSVVIPAYNHEAFIREAVESALASPLVAEVLVCDDASVDGTWTVLQTMADPRLQIMRNEENLGADVTLNRLLDLARGPYLAILNSDDRYLPDRFSKCLEKLESGQFDLVGTDIRLIDQNGKTISNHWWIDAFEKLKSVWFQTNDWVATLLEGNVFMTTSNFVFTRDLWQQLRPFSPDRYVHDYDFLMRAIISGARLDWINKPLLEYRLHSSNTIYERPLQANLEAAALLRRYLPDILSLSGEVSSRIRHFNSQWSRIEGYEIQILKDSCQQELQARESEFRHQLALRDQWVSDRDLWIAQRDGWIKERDAIIADLGQAVKDRDLWIAQRDGWIKERDAIIADLSQAVRDRDAIITNLRFESQILKWRSTKLVTQPNRFGLTDRIKHRVQALRTHWRNVSSLSEGTQLFRVDSFSALRRLIKQRFPDLRVISVDVFDTLVARCIEPPDQIIQRLAQRLADHLGIAEHADYVLHLRQEAEWELRRKAQADGFDHECHYDDLILAWIERLLPDKNIMERQKLASWVEQTELELELLALHPKANARLFLEWAKSEGIRIIAISDMYLGHRHLQKLLHELGYTDLIDRIYVSSEYKVGKYSTALFRHVLKEENLQPSAILHIGDNFYSDVLAPAKLGCIGVFFDERHERIRRRRQFLSSRLATRGGIWPGRRVAEIVAERLRTDPRAHRNDAYFQYGLEVIGPIFSTFMIGLLERVQTDRPDRIFFLARDGHLFLQMYQKAQSLLTGKWPEAVYIYVSRVVTAQAAVADGLDHAKALVGLYNPKQLGLWSILKTYGFDPNEFTDSARHHGFVKMDVPLSDWNDPRLLAFLNDEQVQNRIRTQGQQARELLRLYFEQNGFFDFRKVALVDIGWNATIQRFLEKAFAQGSVYPWVDGYYFSYVHGMHRDELSHGSIWGLIYDRRRGNEHERAALDFEELFEQTARASHGTTIGYRRNNGRVEPILKDDSAADRMAEISCNTMIQSLQEGVLLCFEHYLAAQTLTGDGFDALKQYALAMAERAVAYPTKQEVKLISALAHTEDFGHDNLLNLASSSPSWLEWLHPNRMMRKLINSPWPFAFFARTMSPIALIGRYLHLKLILPK